MSQPALPIIHIAISATNTAPSKLHFTEMGPELCAMASCTATGEVSALCSSSSYPCLCNVPNSESTDFEQLRTTDFARLDAGNHTYLDYTGAGLHPQSIIQPHIDALSNDVLGNPHSENPTSMLATGQVDRTRSHILQFFNADPREYDVIFTANASGALKLIAESYPFRRTSHFALLADNHNSVNGIREYAFSRGARVIYLPITPELRVESLKAVEKVLRNRHRNAPNLFAFPAQSNFSGVKHSLDLVTLAQRLNYHVVLDAAAFVPTSPLDLSTVHPEFVSVSFYKMFGFPTGVGALIAKKSALQILKRPWFAGGTIRFVSVQNNVHLMSELHEAFEDGTVNFMLIPSISRGLKYLENIGMDVVQNHVTQMTALLLHGLSTLKHSNRRDVVRIYGPTSLRMRGGTVNFNIFSPQGAKVDPRIVETEANEKNISLRTGCFCNPGAAEAAFHISAEEMMKCIAKTAAEEFSVEKFSKCMNDPYIGSVRVSVGIASNLRDISHFLSFMESFVDRTVVESRPQCVLPNRRMRSSKIREERRREWLVKQVSKMKLGSTRGGCMTGTKL